MSGYGLFEADLDAEQAPQRQARLATNKLANAINEIRDRYGDFLLTASGKDEFEDRWHYSKADIRKTAEASGCFPNTGTMRRIHDALKREFRAEISGDVTGPQQNLAEGREHSDGAPLIPDANNDYENGESSGVQRDFTPGGDSGHREARALTIDLYNDWARSNGMRIASLKTLNEYADGGISDSTYHLLAGLIVKAGEDCDCDDDGIPDNDEKSEEEHHEDSGDDLPNGDDDSDESEGSDDSDSEDEGGDSDSDSDSAPSESEDSGDGENPFASSDDDSAPTEGDDGPPADDSGFAGPDEGPDLAPEDPPEGDPSDPALAGGDPGGGGDTFEIPDTPPELSPELSGEIPQDDTSGDAAIPPEVIDSILGLPPGTVESLIVQELGGGADGPPPPPDEAGPPVEDDPARLARKLYRRYAADEESGGSPDPSGGADPAGGQATPAPPATPSAQAGAPAVPGPDDGALLDQASQAVTQLVDQKTQQYQQVIDPLQQALQAIQFAQQVEQSENPLDVTPPEGTVDVSPQAPAPEPPPAQAPPAPAPPAAPAMQQQAFRIAKAYNLTAKGYNTVLSALSRKHYQHVAEAIQSLPPEHRIGIAASLADMFGQDNNRFNTGQFMASAGVPMGQDAIMMAKRLRDASNPRDRAGDAWRDGRDRGDAEHEEQDLEDREASRRPFVSSSRREGGETLAPTADLDSFEFPNKGKPEVTDGMKINDLPKPKSTPKIGKPIGEKFMNWEEKHQGLRGLGDAEVDSFVNTHKVGPRASDSLHSQLGLSPDPHPAAKLPPTPKVGSFFTPKVAGWRWDDHLNGYITNDRKSFRCTTAGCDTEIPTPAYKNCKCGRLWNTYAIGDGHHLASDSADLYIAREIPVRDGVIMANRQFQAEEEEFNNASGDGPRQDYPEDIEFLNDDELDENTAHAPGETDASGSKTAASYGDDDHNVTTRDGEKFCSACDAMLWDPNVHHCPAKQASVHFADWTKYDEDDNAGYEKGPDGPPSTNPSKITDDWARRGPEKGPAGQFAPNTFQKRK